MVSIRNFQLYNFIQIGDIAIKVTRAAEIYILIVTTGSIILNLAGIYYLKPFVALLFVALMVLYYLSAFGYREMIPPITKQKTFFRKLYWIARPLGICPRNYEV